jgi:AcrR family transcriptional regulator
MARPPNPEAPHRLLQAARETFAEVGLDAARIQDIAEKAGFSKAAFYLYFESKEAVFTQLVAEFFTAIGSITNERHDAMGALLQRIGPCCAEDWANRSARLDAFTALDHQYNRKALQVMWDNRDMLACVLEHTTGPRRALVDQFIEVLRSTLSGRLREARETGVVRGDIDYDLLSDMILGVWLQIGRRMVRMKDIPDLDQWASAIDQFISKGLGFSPAVQEEVS